MPFRQFQVVVAAHCLCLSYFVNAFCPLHDVCVFFMFRIISYAIYASGAMNNTMARIIRHGDESNSSGSDRKEIKQMYIRIVRVDMMTHKI